MYEPLVSEGAVVGVLYVGVPQVAFSGRIDDVNALDTLVQAVTTATKIARDASAQRRSADDARRHQDMRREIRAADQRRVVEALSAALDRLADADLSRPLDIEFPQEDEKLRGDFNGALRMLGSMVKDISASVTLIYDRGTEISTSANNLSQRTDV